MSLLYSIYRALERTRTITSIPLSEERQILYDMKGIEKSKTAVAKYDVHDKQVQDTKVSRKTYLWLSRYNLCNLETQISFFLLSYFQSLVNELYDGSRLTYACIAEIEAALSKVKLANKLGCKVAELITVQADCPKDKIGKVIGKNGAMIRQIQDLTNAIIDIRKDDDDKIGITGDAIAIAAAVAEIDRIAYTIEEEFTVSSDFVSYLTARHVNVVTKLREEYTDVYFDISRDSTKISIRGMPNRVNAAKKFLLGIEIVKKERKLIGREALILLGRKGSTINKFVEKHEVSIDVEKVDEVNSTATVTGPPGLVDAAMDEIEELMNDSREVIEKINVSSIFKRILLAENAQHMKALQNRVNEELKSQDLDGNTYISFDKDSKEKDHPELLVKAKNSVISTACELVEAGVKELDNLMVHISIDTLIIPRIIGKGGETIRKLSNNKTGYVEVDRVSGKLTVGGTTVEERDAILKDVKDLIAQNVLLRVDVDPALIKTQYRELSRSKTKSELQEIGVSIDSDDKMGQLVLRGKEEDLQLGKEKVLTYLANNYLEVVTITHEDQDALLTGGKESKITKFAEELGVHLSVDRSLFVVVVRGPAENVKSATLRLNHFLKGGDGHSVAHFAVTKQVVGVIIGRGGSTRQQLEQKYDGVSITISKTHNVSIRGPEDKVAACRVEMLKMISSFRVTQTIPVTEEQAVTLERNNAIKRTIRAVSVQIDISDGTAKIRGFFFDVCDAVSLLKEQLTGVYESIIELDAPQFTKVHGATRDPSYLQRMELDTNAKVALDLSAGSLIVSGKRTNVKRAKDQVFDFLDFILPGEMKRLKIPLPLHSSVGQVLSLADLSANAGGAIVYLDRDLSSIIIRSPDPEKVKIAAGLVEQKIKDGEKLAYVMEVAPSEASWLLPLIIGKNGAKISLLRKNSGCTIDVSNESLTVTVTGQSEADVTKGREALDSVVEKARKENLFLSLPETAIAFFVGKGGKNINELASTHGVEIQRMQKGPHSFRVTGQADAVDSAKNAIDEWLKQWEQSNASIMISVEKQEIGTIIGIKGETARALQEEFGCRIDVDRTTLVVSVRGPTEEDRENTANKIKEILEKARQPTPEATQSDEPDQVARKMKDDEKLSYVMEVAPLEASWLLPLIIGKNGAKISLLRKNSGCTIDVSNESLTVTVTGQSEADVTKGREALDSVVEKARKENLFLSLPETAIAFFVGKGGKNINELASTHGVEIQRMQKGPHSFRVTGQADAVDSAKNAIDEWLKQWEQSNASIMISVEKQEIGTIIGIKGETARALQEEFGCRIDVDRTTLVVSVRGPTEEDRENTANKIKEILEKARPEAAPKPTPEATQTDKPEHTPAPMTQTQSNECLIPEIRINRSKEFSAIPVGLAGPPKGKKSGKKIFPIDSHILNGTEAGRNLFQLLASN